MLLNVSTWGACNTSLSLALPKDHLFKSTQPHKDALMPDPPQNRTNAMLRNNYDALVYITNR